MRRGRRPDRLLRKNRKRMGPSSQESINFEKKQPPKPYRRDETCRPEGGSLTEDIALEWPRKGVTAISKKDFSETRISDRKSHLHERN